MIGNIKSANKGRLSANFYVDKWPGFSAVVGELIWPRRSDVSSYGTSNVVRFSVLYMLIQYNHCRICMQVLLSHFLVSGS